MSIPQRSASRRPDIFERTELVGSGTYGEVYRGKKRGESGQILAIKDEHKSGKRGNETDKNKITASTFRELVFLSEVDYPHINHLHLKNISFDQGVSFGYEYGDVTVKTVISVYQRSRDKLIPRVIVKSILFQLLLALDHLHKRNIIHCDVTPSNLLLMAPTGPLPGIVKIIDLGLSRVIDSRSDDRHYGVVTVWYRAPELLLGCTDYNEKIDIWAAGCIFFELLKCEVLFKAPTHGQEDPIDFNQSQMSHIIGILGVIPPEDISPRANHRKSYDEIARTHRYTSQNTLKHYLPPDVMGDNNLYDLLSRMLMYNPAKRISAAEALRHPYFNDEPICVMNVAGEFSPEDWNALRREGSRSHDAK